MMMRWERMGPQVRLVGVGARGQLQRLPLRHESSSLLLLLPSAQFFLGTDRVCFPQSRRGNFHLLCSFSTPRATRRLDQTMQARTNHTPARHHAIPCRRLFPTKYGSVPDPPYPRVGVSQACSGRSIVWLESPHQL